MAPPIKPTALIRKVQEIVRHHSTGVRFVGISAQWPDDQALLGPSVSQAVQAKLIFRAGVRHFYRYFPTPDGVAEAHAKIVAEVAEARLARDKASKERAERYAAALQRGAERRAAAEARKQAAAVRPTPAPKTKEPPPWRAILLELAARPEGVGGVDYGKRAHSTTAKLCALVDEGLLVRRKAGKLIRYFRSLDAAERWARSKMEQRLEAKRKFTISTPKKRPTFSQDEAIIPPTVKVTICPGYRGRYETPDPGERVISNDWFQRRQEAL